MLRFLSQFLPQFLPQSPATAETGSSFSARRKAGPLLSVLPLLIVPGLGLLGLLSGTGHPGQALRRTVLMDARLDAPLPTAPLAERIAYTRELHREDLHTFQAKINFWQTAAHAPGTAGQHAQVKLAQWRRLSQQTRRMLDRQAAEADLP